MKEVVIIKMNRNAEISTEIEFLSNKLDSYTHQLHSLRKMIKRDKRPYTNNIMFAYSDIKKDIPRIRRALTGKFNIIIIRDFTNADPPLVKEEEER